MKIKKFRAGAFFAFLLVLTLAASAVQAEKRTFSAVGEYTMSDYETPAVAEQRAIAYARQRAAEQAGVYVETYTKSEGMQVTEDVVRSMTSSALNVIEQKTSKQPQANGDVHIRAELTAEVDTDVLENMLRQQGEKREQIAQMHAKLQKAIVQQEKENEELKRKIAEMKMKSLPVKDLQIEAKVKELEFLANQKIKEASDCYGKGEFEQVIVLCEEALRLNPKNEWGYIGKSMACNFLGRREEALKHINSALTLFPDNLLANVMCGQIYNEYMEYDKALAMYNRALKIDSNEARIYQDRGKVFLAKGDYQKAIADCDRALELDSKCMPLYYNRGLAYIYTGQYDKAIADCKYLVQHMPKDYAGYMGLGHAYLCKGIYEKAVEEYNKSEVLCSEIKEKMASYELTGMVSFLYSGRARAYVALKKYDKAIVDFNHSLELNPANAQTYYFRGVMYGDKGDFDKAITDFSSALEMDAKFVEAYVRRSIVYAIQGKFEKALADIESALSIEPNDQFAKEFRQKMLKAMRRG